MRDKRELVNWLGLLGVVSFVSYLVAVIFAPTAYPSYDWMSRGVSDLSAGNAPSLALWHQVSSLYVAAGAVCLAAVCIAIKDKLNKALSVGIYLFTIMFSVSAIGFAIFPLSLSGGYGEALQDIMHVYVVLPIVVVLSIASFVMVIIGGFRKKRFVSIAICASVALTLMFVGAIGTAAAPPEYFGVFQRFSNVLSVNGFVAALGIYLFMGKLSELSERNVG